VNCQRKVCHIYGYSIALILWWSLKELLLLHNYITLSKYHLQENNVLEFAAHFTVEVH